MLLRGSAESPVKSANGLDEILVVNPGNEPAAISGASSRAIADEAEKCI